MATTLMPELPREFLAAARKGQEYALDAIRTWAQTVQSALPEISAPRIPYADRLPKPEAVLANAYDFAGQLLASQRHFAEELLKVTEPLMPAIGNARNTPAAPQAPAVNTAPQTPAAHTPAPAPHAPAADAATPEAPAADIAAARTPRTPRTQPKASATSTPRTAPKSAASRRQATPKTTS